MNTVLRFCGLLLLAALLIVLGVLLGDYAPWYFAWVVGSAMIVLVSAAGMVWLDAQEAERARIARQRKSGGAHRT